MRFKLRNHLTSIIIILNIILLYYVWKPSGNLQDYSFVIREFESFDNDLEGTINSIVTKYPDRKLFLITDDIIYPPINTQHAGNNCIIVNRAPEFLKEYASKEPLLQIESKFVFIVPDSSVVPNKNILEGMIDLFEKRHLDFLAVKHKSNRDIDCSLVSVDSRRWNITFSRPKDHRLCNIVKGKHILLARTDVLRKLSDPFLHPFPEALYLQLSALDFQVFIDFKHRVDDGRLLFTSKHNKWKRDQLQSRQRMKLFRKLGVKKVVDENGQEEWYGCRRDTPRCFGTVVDDMPSYLWAGKWTPPCCLKALRETALHVFKELEKSGVRFWLEGGSLLGAYRDGDIIPWDYDVDLGAYKEDIVLNKWLKSAMEKPTVDDDGFLWEKAVEGDFFRVQYSPINHLHVDIFPFFSKNGIMTKNTWFKTHRQDREFPELFLKPLSKIAFIGRDVPAPNSIRDFLELKFGSNAIEHPAYPNPSKLAFPVLSKKKKDRRKTKQSSEK